MIGLASRVATLEAENAELREKLAAFERDVLGDDLVFPSEWRLSPYETRAFACLVKRTQVTSEGLSVAMRRYDQNGDPDFTNVRVVMWRIRRKLALHGIAVKTLWGQGYRLDPASRDRVLACALPGRAAA